MTAKQLLLAAGIAGTFGGTFVAGVAAERQSKAAPAATGDPAIDRRLSAIEAKQDSILDKLDAINTRVSRMEGAMDGSLLERK